MTSLEIEHRAFESKLPRGTYVRENEEKIFGWGDGTGIIKYLKSICSRKSKDESLMGFRVYENGLDNLAIIRRTPNIPESNLAENNILDYSERVTVLQSNGAWPLILINKLETLGFEEK